MAYKWKTNECDVDGIPWVKKAPVVLERDGIQQTFTTQEAVDEAWANGWHDTSRPETAETEYQVKKRGRGRPSVLDKVLEDDDDSE